MQLIFKNLKLKYLLLIFVFTILFVALNRLAGLEPVTALRAVFGGYPSKSTLIMTIFILFVFLLQSINLENIKYTIDNEAYLLVRYGSKTAIFKKLLKVILLSNLIFVVLILIASLFSMFISGSDLTYENTFQVIEIILRGYLTCLIISSIQLILLLKYQETVVFSRMIVLAFVLIMITRLDFILIGCISILPMEISGLPLAFNIIFSVGILIFCVFLAKKEYITREII